jgi:hypothetical protein
MTQSDPTPNDIEIKKIFIKWNQISKDCQEGHEQRIWECSRGQFGRKEE